MVTGDVDLVENKRRMKAGELYHSFTTDLIADRRRCATATRRFNEADDVSRRQLVELVNDLLQDKTPLPPKAPTEAEDESLLVDFPWIDAPVSKMDYGYNVKLGRNVYINSFSTWIDTCPITIGARTLIGPNCSFYSGTHPLDPAVRNGTRGPESGKPINIGEDCWLGGNVIVLTGVTIGRGVTVGAGSVVTKDVPDNVVVVGNPARVLRTIESLKNSGREAAVLAGGELLKS